MNSPMPMLRNTIEHIHFPWPVAQNPSHSYPERMRATYISPNQSVTEILYSARNQVPLAGSRERSLGGILSASMVAIKGLFTTGMQRLWQGNNLSLPRNSYPMSKKAAEAGRLTLSTWTATGSGHTEVEDAVSGEILDGDYSVSNLVDPVTARSPLSPSFEEKIVATWARVAEESRTLGMPMEKDVVGYLQTRAHNRGSDEAETHNILDKYMDQIEPDKHANYGTMPKDVGYAWVHSTLLFHEGEDDEATRNSIKGQMREWGWNDAAVAVTFGEIAQENIAKEAAKNADPKLAEAESNGPQATTSSAPGWRHVPGGPRPQSPEQVAAASIHGGGSSGTPPPPKTTERSEGWRKWLPLGIVGGVIFGVVGLVLGTSASSHGPEPGPSPSTAAPSSPAAQTPGRETPGGETGDDDQGGNDEGDDNGGDEATKYSDATKDMVKVRTAEDGRLFVDATKWKPQRTTMYPTYWNLAGEQIRANEDRKPTMREYVFVKNALLRVNHETEASARRMRIGHDMFLLSATQYEDAMAKAAA